MLTAAIALALAGTLAACSEEDPRDRGTVPVIPAPAEPADPGTESAVPAPADSTTAEDLPLEDVTQNPSAASFTLDGESISPEYLSCMTFTETQYITLSGTNAAGKYVSLDVNAEGQFIHMLGIDEDWVLVAEWGDLYHENTPTVSVTNDVWSIAGTVRATDGTLKSVEAEIPCAVDTLYDGVQDRTLEAPELVVRQEYDLSALMSTEENQIWVDGVQVPSVGAAQCTLLDDGFRSVGLTGIMENGGTVEVGLDWNGNGRAPSIDVIIEDPEKDYFSYWWSEGYSEDNPPAVAVIDKKYALGGTVDYFGQKYEVAAVLICP